LKIREGRLPAFFNKEGTGGLSFQEIAARKEKEVKKVFLRRKRSGPQE